MANRKVRVRKRPDSPQLQLYVWDSLTGKYRTRSAGTDNPKEAERAAERWSQELEKGGVAGVISWAQFRERFQDEYLPGYPQSTRDSYLKAFRAFERHIGSPARLNAVTSNVLSDYKGKLVASGISSATVAGYLRHLMVALAWAAEIGIMAKAPRVRLPRGGTGSAKSKPLEFKEVDAIAEAARAKFPEQGEMVARLLWLIWFTGLRLGEARILSWDWGPIVVSLNAPFPRIIFGANSQKSGNVEEVPITKQAVEWFQSIPAAERKGYVCPIVFGKDQAGRDLLSHKIGEAAAAAGVRGGAHDIRRSFATRMAKLVNPYALQRLMRHSSLSTTMTFYVSLKSADIAAQLGTVTTSVASEPTGKTATKRNRARKRREK